MYTTLNALVAIFIIVFSIIAHELGHWVVLARLKVPITEWWLGLGPAIFKFGRCRIGLFPIGAALYPEHSLFNKLSARQKMAVALGGPIGSAVYGMALLIASTKLPASHMGLVGLNALALANFSIALFNILPIPPLDGFHLMEALFDHIGRPFTSKAKAMSYRLGNGLVFGLGFFYITTLLIKPPSI